jgi:hypothetical protein
MRVDLDGGQGSGGSGRRRWVDQGGEPVVRRDRGSNYKLASIPPALDPSLSWRGAFGCERTDPCPPSRSTRILVNPQHELNFFEWRPGRKADLRHILETDWRETARRSDSCINFEGGRDSAQRWVRTMKACNHSSAR